MKKLNTQSPDFQAELKALLAFETAQNPEIDRIVADARSRSEEKAKE